MMIFYWQQCYGADSATYATEMSVSSAYVLTNDGVPTNAAFPTEINNANRGSTETIGPYNLIAFTNIPDAGIKLTLHAGNNTTQHPPGSDQLYLVHVPLVADRSEQSQRVPYKVLFRPCYNSAFPPGTPRPEIMTLHPDPEGNENVITSVYANDVACFPSRTGEPGQVSFEREAMTVLPLAGTYEGSVSIEIGPE